MRVLFKAGLVQEVSSVEVVSVDVLGDGNITTQVNFVLSPSGDKLEYLYSQDEDIEKTSERAIMFIQNLYKDGFADFSGEPAMML